MNPSTRTTFAFQQSSIRSLLIIIMSLVGLLRSSNAFSIQIRGYNNHNNNIRPAIHVISNGKAFSSSRNRFSGAVVQSTANPASSSSSSSNEASSPAQQQQPQQKPVSLYRSEGLFAVEKPVDWTCSNVVSYIRGVLERDARNRGANPAKVGRRNKSRVVKVGHGGTLDPLAVGVLVIGVGKGTKELQSYLSGSKRYTAGVELGFETTTLDMEGNVTKRAPFDHVTMEDVEKAMGKFVGTISQVPPIFSAIKKDGKRLYKHAREGASAEDVKIEPRLVSIYNCEVIPNEEESLPRFDIDVECGGGTYIRSLVRDLGYELGTVATITYLARTQQAQFRREQCLQKDEWSSADEIYQAIDRFNEQRSQL